MILNEYFFNLYCIVLLKDVSLINKIMNTINIINLVDYINLE
ncbi:conserved hypothetical protein [Xenorhabdus bovienii str. feltiae Moldova]|uniref:Uncharacterized protein n=1 Tax=Xenorhabdus bovienii str. feltiae Moldova TaxID=1398200 RepID=A0A077NNJ4_XENBV|nr:conserved hypothetical protein [Xenorhabdus bovienii str. feltiae Moldova]